MKKIPVEKITEPVILAREVVGVSGNVLLKKGISVSPALGRRLKNWGISIVYIEGEDEAHQEHESITVSPEAIKAALKQKFDGVMDSEIMKTVFKAAVEFRVTRKQVG